MAESNRDLLLGLAQVTLVTAILVFAGFLGVHAGAVRGAVVRAARRVGVLRTPLPVTYATPLECVAASLRRVAGAMRCPDEGMTQVRKRGLEMAYDDLLSTACRQLGLPESLAARTGWDREIERLRMEASLERAGLAIRPVRRGQDR